MYLINKVHWCGIIHIKAKIILWVEKVAFIKPHRAASVDPRNIWTMNLERHLRKLKCDVNNKMKTCQLQILDKWGKEGKRKEATERRNTM